MVNYNQESKTWSFIIRRCLTQKSCAPHLSLTPLQWYLIIMGTIRAMSPPCHINCALVIFCPQASGHRYNSAIAWKAIQSVVCAGDRAHLVLLELVLGWVFSLTFPPELLQVCLRALQGVLLQLVLRLIALEGGLTHTTGEGWNSFHYRKHSTGAHKQKK